MNEVKKASRGGFIRAREGVLQYTIPYQQAKKMDDRIKWKGEWQIMYKDGFYPIPPPLEE
jgi:hypothetical protein